MVESYSTKIQPVKVAVIHPIFPHHDSQGGHHIVLKRSPEQALEEAVHLCQALPLDVVEAAVVNVREVSPQTFLGKGKVATLKEAFKALEVALVVINTRLQPSQQRNLELAFKVKVIDRTGLILEIFSDRAQTHAGRLQVALAQLQYQSSRLVRTWTHLERQRGGLGKTGGPGERQIELDRRMIREKIDKIRKELAAVEKTRALHRKGRIKSDLPVVALVGYTNAGKSTLFNRLAGEKKAFVKDMLFATLDPLMRKVRLASGREIILSDTVGFISDLPHELVQAFHATLEEVTMADLLLHVEDASNPDRQNQAQDVQEVLQAIGAEGVPQICVYNKQDAPGAEAAPKEAWGLSAQTGVGVEALEEEIEAFFAQKEEVYHLRVPAGNGRAIAWLQAHGDVRHMVLANNTYEIDVLLSEENMHIFEETLQ